MLRDDEERPGGARDVVQWSARGRLSGGDSSVVLVRSHTLRVSAPLSFRASGDSAASALDTLLAALAGEFVTGFAQETRRRQLHLDSLECVVTATLENPLVAAGVVGESGSPAIAELQVTLFAASPDLEDSLRNVFREFQRKLPVLQTLAKACPIQSTFKLIL